MSIIKCVVLGRKCLKCNLFKETLLKRSFSQVLMQMLIRRSIRIKNTEEVEIFWKTDFFRNPKICVFQRITIDFENRLKHQVTIILCAVLDFDLLVHI